MKALMWLRKRAGKLTGNSRGFSSVIGTIFMVLMVMTLATSVFLWTLYQNTLYNNAVKTQNQQELDARNENVVANGNYSVPSAGVVSVIANLTNAGPVTAQIVSLWVFDTNTTKQTYGFNNSVSNKPWANLTWATLKAGQVLKFTNSNATKVTVPSAVSGDSFSIWFVTARGNTVPLTQAEPVQTIIVADVAQGIGSMALDFSTFGYYTYATTTRLANYPTGTVSFNIPVNTYVAFRASIRNLDPRKLTITLDSHSLFWQPSGTGAPENSWFMVNVRPDGTINGTYTPITIAYLETKTVIFASGKDLGLGSFSQQRVASSATGATVAAFLLLHGFIGSSPYGQNIPFVAINYY